MSRDDERHVFLVFVLDGVENIRHPVFVQSNIRVHMERELIVPDHRTTNIFLAIFFSCNKLIMHDRIPGPERESDGRQYKSCYPPQQYVETLPVVGMPASSLVILGAG